MGIGNREGRRKFGNGFCNGFNGCQEEGRRGKKEGSMFIYLT
ncbi:hypothetical protein QUB56_03305 [Microcoleus sp. AR_TQ3_B6]